MVETRFQTSFIPGKPLATPAGVVYRRDGGGKSWFLIVAIILLVIAGLAALGLFLYKSTLEKSIETKDQELTVLYQTLNQDDIKRFITLGKKTESVQSIFSKHTAFSRVASFLEATTLQNIQLKTFLFEAEPGTPAKITVQGKGQSYAAVASQAYVLKGHEGVAESKFGSLILDDKGDVSFSANLTLKPSAYVYQGSIKDLSILDLPQ